MAARTKRNANANAREKVWGAAAADGQLSFAQRRSWGGPRARSGRKASPRAKVRHLARPRHAWWAPIHITLRRAKGLPSLRSERLHNELREAVRATKREDFRIVHYSVQADHVHMVVEAEDARALASGMKSFTIRAARRLNSRVLGGRRGSLWGDRYHRRDLGSPREVRNVLVYVNNNYLKHFEIVPDRVDPCSSAPWFTGWMQVFAPPPEPSPVALPQTWLLARGWHDNIRFIHVRELPRALRA